MKNEKNLTKHIKMESNKKASVKSPSGNVLCEIQGAGEVSKQYYPGDPLSRSIIASLIAVQKSDPQQCLPAADLEAALRSALKKETEPPLKPDWFFEFGGEPLARFVVQGVELRTPPKGQATSFWVRFDMWTKSAAEQYLRNQ